MARNRISIREAFETLGLAYGASWDEVKKRFRELAKKWHPDRSALPNAEEVFSKIATAYERLEEWNNAGRPEPRKFQYSHLEEQAKRKAAQQKRDAHRRAELYKRARIRKLKREKEQAKEYRIAIGILLAFLVVYFGGRTASREYESYLIEKNPGMTYARVYNQEQNLIYYIFEVDGEIFTDEMRVKYARNTNRSLTGLPLHLNDEFSLEYYKDDPEYHVLDFHKPHPNTLERYISDGQVRLMQLFPQSFITMSASDKLTNSRCLVLMVFEEFGFDGLANLTFSGESFWKNWSNNEGTFQDMVEEEEFKGCFQSCRLEFTNPL